MPNGAKRNPLIAVDSNVLLDRANDDELVIDALDTVRRRLPACELIVTPTVIEEIVLKAERGDTPLDRRLARRVLASLVEEWGFRPMSFFPWVVALWRKSPANSAGKDSSRTAR